MGLQIDKNQGRSHQICSIFRTDNCWVMSHSKEHLKQMSVGGHDYEDARGEMQNSTEEMTCCGGQNAYECETNPQCVQLRVRKLVVAWNRYGQVQRMGNKDGEEAIQVQEKKNDWRMSRIIWKHMKSLFLSAIIADSFAVARGLTL